MITSPLWAYTSRATCSQSSNWSAFMGLIKYFQETLLIAKQKIGTIIKELREGVKEYRFSVIGSLFNVLGTGCLLISFNYTYASIASPLTAIYTPFVLIYSFAKLKEKINKINLCGIVLALIGAFGIILVG